MTDFLKDLTGLINKYSKENSSNTPDWILAEYLESCLEVFNKTINKTAPLHQIVKSFQAESLTAFVDALSARTKWYGSSQPPEVLERPLWVGEDAVELEFSPKVEKRASLADTTGPRTPESKL